MRLAAKCTLLGNDALEDRRQQHQVDESGIELSSSPRRDHVGGGSGAAAASIASIVRDGVEGVGEGHDASREWYGMAAEAIGISGAVPSFVVTEHAFLQLGVEGRQRSENGGAASGMRRDGASLGGREMGVFVDDVEQRLVNLADVMKERDAFHDPSFVLVELRGVREDEGVCGDASDVGASVGVVGVDGVEQRLEAGGGKAFGGFTAPAFAYEQGAGEDARGGGKSRSHAATQGKIHVLN